MCTICQALDPSNDTYDFHDLENFSSDGMTLSAAQPVYGYDQIADYLTEGYWADSGAPERSFDVETGGTITFNVSGLTELGADTARKALEAWTAVSGLQFEEVTSTSGAQIVFDDNFSGAFAWSSASNGNIIQSNINISASWANYGDYYFQTYMHEIGHALGLGHTGNYNGGANYGTDALYANDSWQTSVMSYFDQRENSWTDASFAYLATLQLGDIAAIQKLYGTPTNIETGDTIYGEGATTTQFGMDLSGRYAVAIVDNGGTDLINLASSSKHQTLSLVEETYSSINGKIGNFSIGRNTVIENATTGSGNDTIIGNAADNRLDAGAGNDVLRGNGGNDRLIGGAGADTIDGGAGTDTAVYGQTLKKFYVIYDADTLANGVLKLGNGSRAVDQLTNVEQLAIGSEILNVADIAAKLKSTYGTIPEGSSASFKVSLTSLENGGEPSTKLTVPEAARALPLGMEIGSTRILQLDSSYWQSVTFEEAIENAAVVMGPASSEGGQPLSIRVRNVTDTGFEFQVDEWNYLDGYHVEVSVSWMAGSMGTHTLADGTRLSFGKQDVTSTELASVNLTGFDDKPMVFAQLTGDNENTALTHRLYDVTTNGFSCELQAEESKVDSVSSIAEEDLFWAAIDIANDSFIFESGTVKTGHEYALTGTRLDGKEGFFADMQTMNGADTAGLRYNLGNTGQVSLRVEEEASADKEIFHMDETLAWFTATEGSFDFI